MREVSRRLAACLLIVAAALAVGCSTTGPELETDSAVTVRTPAVTPTSAPTEKVEELDETPVAVAESSAGSAEAKAGVQPQAQEPTPVIAVPQSPPLPISNTVKPATQNPVPAPAVLPAPAVKPSPPPKQAAAVAKPVVTVAAEPSPAQPVAQVPVRPRSANVLRGSVTLVAKGRQKLQPGEVSDSVVYFRPSTGSVELKPGRHTIYTRNKAFDPALTVVQRGSTVAFPNSDPILHNVHSNTPGQEFDFGFYGEGETKSYQFDRAGLVLVSCNVHHVMAANVLVLDTPYYTRPDANGQFVLKDLPSGLGELVFWHPRGAAQTQAMAIPAEGTVNRRLDINRPPLGVARR